MRGMFAVATALLVALAGCADADPEEPGPDGPDDDAPEALTTGTLRGLVIDPAIRPIEGAVVTLIDGAGDLVATLTTDADGNFGTDGLAPGTYNVTAQKPGFVAATLAGDVIAGATTPDRLEIMMQVAIVDDSFVLPISYQGVIACAAGASWCGFVEQYSGVELAGDGAQRMIVEEFTDVQRVPDMIQVEVHWEPQSEFAGHLSYQMFMTNHERWASTDQTSCKFNDIVYSEPPLIASYTNADITEGGQADTMEGCELGINMGVANALFAGCIPWPGCWAEYGPPDAMLNQQFEGIIHVFYGCLPPEGWSFIRDGAAECTPI